MKYILVKCGKKPEIVDVDCKTKAGNLRIQGEKGVFRKTTGNYGVEVFKREEDFLYENEESKYLDLMKKWSDREAKKQEKLKEQQEHRERVDARLKQQLEYCKESFQEIFEDLWDNRREYIMPDQYEEGGGVTKYIMISGEIPANPDRQQGYNWVTAQFSQDSSDDSWRVYFSRFRNSTGAISGSLRSNTTHDCLWELLSAVYFAYH